MREPEIRVVVCPRAVLYHGGVAHGEGAYLTLPEADARRFQEYGIVTGVDRRSDSAGDSVPGVRAIALVLCAGLAIFLGVLAARTLT